MVHRSRIVKAWKRPMTSIDTAIRVLVAHPINFFGGYKYNAFMILPYSLVALLHKSTDHSTL
jgi:hypothetical protein